MNPIATLLIVKNFVIASPLAVIFSEQRKQRKHFKNDSKAQSDNVLHQKDKIKKERKQVVRDNHIK
jgi:hypothetical protein